MDGLLEATGWYGKRFDDEIRFFRGMTQSRIAQQLGISQMHVSRLLSGCFDQLRAELLAETG